MAQNNFLILDPAFNRIYESRLINESDTFHSAIYPRILFLAPTKASSDSALLNGHFSKIRHQYIIQNPSKTIRITPILNSSFSLSTQDNNPYQAGGGIEMLSQWGDKFSVKAVWYGAKTQLNFADFLLADSIQMVPGEGEFNARLGNSFVYTNWMGYLSYNPAPYINFQLGKDKNFWGDGYRSLLLSDNTASYPFLKATVAVGKLQYIILYQMMRDFDSQLYSYPNENKYATSHFLSLNLGRRFNINLFETVVWRNQLDDDGIRGFDYNYLNPVIFFRPIEHSVGSPDNVLIGGGGRIRWFKSIHTYAQLILDEFKLKEYQNNQGWWGNKFGYQLGIKWYNAFGLKNFFLLAEYNTVRPYTYSHVTSMENYGQMHQALAHPLGANFKEIIFDMQYQYRSWVFSGYISSAKFGLDKDSTNFGQNIYRSYNDNPQQFGNTVLQGELTLLQKAEFKVSYIINPVVHWQVETGVHWQTYQNTTSNWQELYWFVGMKTLF